MLLNNNLSNNMLANTRVTFNSTTKIESSTSISTTDTKLPTKVVLGYGVDDDGYFTEDFNQAAGIPEHIKIHSSSMESLVRVETDDSPEYFLSRIFSEVDIAKTIGNAYKVFSQLVDGNTLNKENFTTEEIMNLPQGYRFDRTTLDVSNVHKDIFEHESQASMQGYKYSDKERNYSLFWKDNSNPNDRFKPVSDIFAITSEENSFLGSWNTAGEKYTNADGTISMGGLLVAMVRNNTHLTEGKATYRGQLEGYDRNVDVEAIQAEYYASWGKSVFDYSDQELNSMSEQRRDFIKGMQKEQMKIWIANGSDIPANARKAYNAMKDEDSWKYVNPFEQMLENLDKANKELLERLRQKAIESRQKAQEEAKKQANKTDINKLYEESNKAIQEFAKLIEALQTKANKTKDPKDQWNVSADSIQKAFLNLLNEQNKQGYQSNTQQPTSTFEVKA